MLNVNLYLDELKQLSKKNLRICRINWWLMKYENEFLQAIDLTSCKKWSNWLSTGEKVFPCVCSKRDINCAFIELYRELDKLTKIQKLETKFKDYFNQFQLVKESKDLITLWMLDIKPLINKIYFLRDSEENIKIKVSNINPIFEINIFKDDYKYALLCLEIFNNNFYKRNFSLQAIKKMV